MYTFCFEIGCDLPSDDEIKLIYSLLVAHSNSYRDRDEFMGDKWDENQGDTLKMSTLSNKKKCEENLKKPSLYLLIKLCL
jgi:hypothetical protein